MRKWPGEVFRSNGFAEVTVDTLLCGPLGLRGALGKGERCPARSGLHWAPCPGGRVAGSSGTGRAPAGPLRRSSVHEPVFLASESAPL